MKRLYQLLTFLVFIGADASAQQVDGKASGTGKQGFLFTPHWAYQYAGGDLADRFYNFASIGLGAEYKTKAGWHFGVDYDWFYGEKVRDSTLFDGITGPSKQVIDQNGQFSIIELDIQGHFIEGHIGYVIPLGGASANSGLYMALGGGYLWHKVDIRSSQVTIPQLNDEYEKGYDRLTGGPALREFIGYQYLEQTNRFHFRAGFEFNQAFTRGLRTWNYSTNTSGEDQRLDMPMAFKFSLIVPVYTKESQDEEFFID